MFLGCYCVLGGGWLGKGGGGVGLLVVFVLLFFTFVWFLAAFFLLLFSLKNKMFMFLTMWPRSSLAGWICHDNFTRKRRKKCSRFPLLFCSWLTRLQLLFFVLFLVFVCVIFFFLIFLLFFFFFWVLNCFCFLLLFLSVLCFKSVMHLTLADTKLQESNCWHLQTISNQL